MIKNTLLYVISYGLSFFIIGYIGFIIGFLGSPYTSITSKPVGTF